MIVPLEAIFSLNVLKLVGRKRIFQTKREHKMPLLLVAELYLVPSKKKGHVLYRNRGF